MAPVRRGLGAHRLLYGAVVLAFPPPGTEPPQVCSRRGADLFGGGAMFGQGPRDRQELVAMVLALFLMSAAMGALIATLAIQG